MERNVPAVLVFSSDLSMVVSFFPDSLFIQVSFEVTSQAFYINEIIKTFSF